MFPPLMKPITVHETVLKITYFGQQSRISLNLRTVVMSWSYFLRGKRRIDYQNDQSSLFWGCQAYFEDFSWGILNLFKSAAYWKPCWKCLEKCQHILWLISSFKQCHIGGILAVFQGQKALSDTVRHCHFVQTNFRFAGHFDQTQSHFHNITFSLCFCLLGLCIQVIVQRSVIFSHSDRPKGDVTEL